MQNEKSKVIARVFPSRTAGTPLDDMAFVDGPPFWRVKCDEVHVSCTFTWDKARAEGLAEMWEKDGYTVKLGGPAYDDPGDEFVPGRYLKPGYVFTSRGCNNSCWFCMVPGREGRIRELPIVDGWRVLDSNLLQCTEEHIRAVGRMLKKQRMPSSFLGGFDASEMRQWHAEWVADVRPVRLYLAYDEPGDWEGVSRAWSLLEAAGIRASSHVVSCYVLMGYEGDTVADAVERLERVKATGMTPFAMFYRDDKNKKKPKPREWAKLQKEWTRPELIYAGGAKAKNSESEVLW